MVRMLPNHWGKMKYQSQIKQPNYTGEILHTDYRVNIGGHTIRLYSKSGVKGRQNWGKRTTNGRHTCDDDVHFSM